MQPSHLFNQHVAICAGLSHFYV